MKEVWRDIGGYEGLYQVSSFGKIKSLNYRRTGVEKLLKTRNDRDGYLFLLLYKNGQYKRFFVHRLVALAFIPNPDALLEVNHISGVKENNNVCNLEWCTRSQNEIHAYRVLKIVHPQKGKYGKENHSSKPICQFSKNGQLIAKYDGQNEASRKTGIKASAISACIRGKSKYSGGYVWKFNI